MADGDPNVVRNDHVIAAYLGGTAA
ncbi:MAG: hypothetical protein R2710_08920 [Acidimicrobiales bacterium]